MAESLPPAQPQSGRDPWLVLAGLAKAAKGDPSAFFESLSEKPDTLSSTQQETLGSLGNVDRILTDLKGIYKEAGGGMGRFMGAAAGAANKYLGVNPALGDYLSARESSAAQLARALGETGVLNDQDIKRALASIPDVTDTAEEAERKFGRLQRVMNYAKEAALNTPKTLTEARAQHYTPQTPGLSSVYSSGLPPAGSGGLPGLGGY